MPPVLTRHVGDVIAGEIAGDGVVVALELHTHHRECACQRLDQRGFSYCRATQYERMAGRVRRDEAEADRLWLALNDPAQALRQQAMRLDGCRQLMLRGLVRILQDGLDGGSIRLWGGRSGA